VGLLVRVRVKPRRKATVDVRHREIANDQETTDIEENRKYLMSRRYPRSDHKALINVQSHLSGLVPSASLSFELSPPFRYKGGRQRYKNAISLPMWGIFHIIDLAKD
jgi:hypothetical protein